MTDLSAGRLERALDTLPQRYAGPGGGAVVLRDGEVLAQRCWGWADVERRVRFTPQTLFLACSITKQFTCGLVLDQFGDPTALDADVRRMLPDLRGDIPLAQHLCHNQSGLRDYWATAMLCGAPVEGVFTEEDARRLIGRTRTLQFAPGTRYSYCNQNFRILSDIVERRTGKRYADLLHARIFDPAGMPTARLNPDTAETAGGAVGYEGSVDAGFRPAVNRIVWTGDAGLAASLEDFIAWERHIDATRDDSNALYNRLSAPVSFRDGTPSSYGFGLARSKQFGRDLTAHGGGLRGWRSYRVHAGADRVSVVVLFNHMADAREAAIDLLAAVLDAPAPATHTASTAGWPGKYIEPETGLAVQLEDAAPALRLRFAPGPETLAPAPDGGFASASVRLRREGDAVRMDRSVDNLSSRLLPCAGDPSPDITGAFHNDELDARLTCVDAGGVLYGAFSGVLGQGEMHALLPFAPDIWLLPCPRALDYSAPGDWTLRFRRDEAGRVAAVDVGCWLARGIVFARA
jgi:D-aminopeptidase